MFFSVVCFQTLVVRTLALKGVWGTATIFFSLKPGIPKVGSGITSKFLDIELAATTASFVNGEKSTHKHMFLLLFAVAYQMR